MRISGYLHPIILELILVLLPVSQVFAGGKDFQIFTLNSSCLGETPLHKKAICSVNFSDSCTNGAYAGASELKAELENRSFTR